MKRLVILGGGTAGTMVANKLRAALGSHEVHITVVDRDDAHAPRTSWTSLRAPKIIFV